MLLRCLLTITEWSEQFSTFTLTFYELLLFTAMSWTSGRTDVAPIVAANFNFGKDWNCKTDKPLFINSAPVCDHTLYIDSLGIQKTKVFTRSESILLPGRWQNIWIWLILKVKYVRIFGWKHTKILKSSTECCWKNKFSHCNVYIWYFAAKISAEVSLLPS